MYFQNSIGDKFVKISTIETANENWAAVLESFFCFITEKSGSIVNELPTPCFKTYEYSGYTLHEIEIDQFFRQTEKFENSKYQLIFGEFKLTTICLE